jgi:hypothetical protein
MAFGRWLLTLGLIVISAAPAPAAVWTSGTPHGIDAPVFADPANPARVYLGPASRRLLYVSDDRGLHWTARTLPRTGLVIRAAAGPPAMLVAHGQHDLGPIYRSVDQGRTWTTGGCCARAVDPGNPLRMVGFSNGLARSLDGGATWTPMPPPPVGVSFAFDGGGLLWASAPTSESVARSGDFGDTWQVVTGVPEGVLTPVPGVAGVLWSSGWRTDNGGVSWQEMLRDDSCPPAVPEIIPVSATPAMVWAVACGGLYHSGDAAASWARVGDVHGPNISVAPIEGGAHAIIGGSAGVWLVEPGAAPSYRGDGLPPTIPFTLSADPRRRGRAFAGTFRTDDAGSTWRATPTGESKVVVVGGRLVGEGRTGIVSTPVEGGQATTLLEGPASLLGGDPQGRRAWFLTNAGLWTTVDGVNVTRVSAAFRGLFEPDSQTGITPAAGGRGRTLLLFVVGKQYEAVSLSHNGGRTFRTVETAIGAHSVAVDAIDGRLILAVNNRGLLVSTDGGRRFALKLRDARAIAVDSRRRGRWYAARSRTLYVTDDAGATWRRLPSPPGGAIRTIAFGAGRLWATTRTRISSLPVGVPG